MEFWFFMTVLAVAVIALVVNIRFKLPKKIFLALTVLIIVMVMWMALDPGRFRIPKIFSDGESAKGDMLPSIERFKIISGKFDLVQGENNFTFPAKKFAGKDGLTCVIHFSSKIEAESLSHLSFELKGGNGRAVSAAGMQIFEEDCFVKSFFMIPEGGGDFSELSISNKGEVPISCVSIDAEISHGLRDASDI